MTLQWLMGWWNLIFLAPFAIALLYLGVMTLTGIGAADADADAGDDAPVDAHADADLHADADADMDADADHDVAGAHGGGGGAGHSSLAALALWFGVGRAPLSLVLMFLCLTWGASGLLINTTLRDAGRPDGWPIARVAVPLALLISLFVTRILVLLMVRYAPMSETAARPRRAMVGAVGEALYPIDESFGMVAVRDENGSLQHVPCRVAPGIAPIDKGAAVKLVAYSATDQMFYVAAVDPLSPAAPSEEKARR